MDVVRNSFYYKFFKQTENVKMLKTKQTEQLAQATKVTIFSGTEIIVQVMCKNVDEVNAVLNSYNETNPNLTFKLSTFNYVV